MSLMLFFSAIFLFFNSFFKSELSEIIIFSVGKLNDIKELTHSFSNEGLLCDNMNILKFNTNL